jgi:DUF4097 and DUF4098 domain-containing protein YvlB
MARPENNARRTGTGRAALIAAVALLVLPSWPGWRAADGPFVTALVAAAQSDRETRPLSIGSAGAVDVSTFSGDITVTAGTGPASVEIRREGHGRAARDAQSLREAAQVTVDVQNDRARIRVSYPRGRSDVSVSFVLIVPAGTKIVAHAVSGDIKTSGVTAEITADTASGDIALTGGRRAIEATTMAGTVHITDATLDDAATAHSVGGDVILTRVKARRVTASTIGGDVTARTLTCDELSLKTTAGSVEFSGPLARGGRYEIHTQSGDVRFAPTGDVGFSLDVETFSGEIRMSKTMRIDHVSHQARSLTGTVGTADATVRIVSFNGDVTIGSS